MIWEGSILVYLTSYMFGKSKWHSPFVKLSSVELVHQQEQDFEPSQIHSTDAWNDLR